MEAQVIPDGLRAEEDVSFSCHHQDKAVECLQRQTPSDRSLAPFYRLFIASVNNSVFLLIITQNSDQ